MPSSRRTGRTPTTKQAARLAPLGNPNLIVVTPRRSEWAPLLRNGWVERADPKITPRGAFLPPLQVTPDGLRALAAALERDGRPGLRGVCERCGGRIVNPARHGEGWCIDVR